jgi:hypothetical protein
MVGGRVVPAKPRPFKRAGLHRLECPDCPCYGYFTVAMLEAAGELPACFAVGCGARMMPTELELAALLGATSAAVWEDYNAALESARHGLAPHIHGHRKRKSAVSDDLAGRAETIAAERVAARRRDVARSNRLRAIAPVAAPIPF